MEDINIGESVLELKKKFCKNIENKNKSNKITILLALEIDYLLKIELLTQHNKFY